MGRPPLGTRWGDLSPEQRAALPVGTVLRITDDIWLRLTRHGWYYEGPGVSPGWGEVDPPFYALLHQSDPRDNLEEQ